MLEHIPKYPPCSSVLADRAGLSCAEPIDLGSISSPLTFFTTQLANVLVPSCARSSTAADVVFSLDVPAGLTVELQQRFSNYDSVGELRHGGTCPGDSLIQCVVHGTQGVSERLVWKNSSPQTVTVFYLQTGTADSHGQFTIAWRVYSSGVVGRKVFRFLLLMDKNG